MEFQKLTDNDYKHQDIEFQEKIQQLENKKQQ